MAFGSDVDITVGADTSAAQAGLAALRNQAASVGSSVASSFSSMISPAALVTAALTTGVKAVVDYGDRIFELGKRFGVSTTDLQQFGNAAEVNGASLDSMAMGFNRLDVALSKARGGNKEMQKSLEDLNVKDWANKSLSLSAAMLEIGSSGMDAADMVKVLGKNGTELRETLRNLSNGTQELGAAISQGTVQKLHEWDDWLKKTGQDMRVFGAEVIGVASKVWDSSLTIHDAMVHAMFRGPSAGPAGAPTPTGANIPTKEQMTPEGQELRDVNALSAAEDLLNEKRQANWMASMDNEGKLNELKLERQAVENELNSAEADGTLNEEQRVNLETQIEDITSQILPIQKQIADETARAADETERQAEAEAKAAASAQAKAEADARDAKTQADQAAANQIRDAAGALAFYNLRVGATGSFPSFFNSPQGAGQLTGPALATMQKILTLSTQMSVPNMSPANTTLLANQIQNLIPLFQQQLQLLTSINKNLTPRPGGI